MAKKPKKPKTSKPKTYEQLVRRQGRIAEGKASKKEIKQSRTGKD